MIKVGVFFGTGFEEIEALTVVDLLRRVGILVSMISINSESKVVGGHQISVEMDEILEAVNFAELNMLVLPGGLLGIQNLELCELLMNQVKLFDQQNKNIAAICAAPSILGRLGILRNRKACVYPGLERELQGAILSEQEVEISGHIITSRGLGTSISFALAIVEKLQGREAKKKLADSIIFKG